MNNYYYERNVITKLKNTLLIIVLKYKNEHTSFNLLYNNFLKLKILIPTSYTCEGPFLIFKYVQRINILTDTIKVKLFSIFTLTKSSAYF